MEAIFLDPTEIKPTKLKIIIFIVKLFQNKDNRIAVLFGLNNLSIQQRKKFAKEYNMLSFTISCTIGTPDGIEIQEYCNKSNIEHLCVISNKKDIRPFQRYRIYPFIFFLFTRIFLKLRLPYINHMKHYTKTFRHMF